MKRKLTIEPEMENDCIEKPDGDIFVELSYDPGTRDIGQSVVSIRENLDTNIDTNYQFEHVKVVDCIGDDGTKKHETEKILANLNNHLLTDKTVQEFIKLRDNTKYNIGVTIESQEGLTKIGRNIYLAVAMIQMGIISGAIYEFFASRGITVALVDKKAKWGYTQNSKKTNKTIEIDPVDPKTNKKNINKKSNKKQGCINGTIDGGVKKTKNTKTGKKPHKINTKKIVLDILSRQNTEKSKRITRWFKRNKKKAQHAQDSLLAAMKRLQQRIKHKKNT